MKRIMLMVTLLFITTLMTPHVLSPPLDQGYTRWSLPEGAKARWGKGRIHEIQYSPNGTLLAVASSIGIWLYDTTNFREVALFTVRAADAEPHHFPFGSADDVGSVRFSPDGQTLVSGHGDGILRLWGMAKGTLERTFTGHAGRIHRVCFSPDGQKLASSSIDRTIRLWDVATGALQLTLAGHNSSVLSVYFSPDGQTLASTTRGDDSLRLWDVTTGNLLYTLDANGISFSPDGQTLASVREKEILLWDVSTGTLRKTFSEHTSSIQNVRFSPDGQKLASGSGSGTTRLWDVTTGTLLRTFAEYAASGQSDARDHRLRFSPDGQMLASGSSVGLLLWDVATGTLRKTLINSPASFVNNLRFSPDGQTLASVGEGGIQLWDVSTGTLRRTFTGHPNWVASAGFSTDGQTLANAEGDDIQLWDVVTGTIQCTLAGNTWWTTGMNFSPDGEVLASQARNGIIRLWDVSTGTLLNTLPGISRSFVQDGQSDSLRFSPEGQTLASGSRNSIRLWDVSTGALRKTLINSHSSSTEPSTVSVVSTGALRKTLINSPPLFSVNSVSFSPDGQTLASGSRDGIRLWDVPTGAPLRLLYRASSDNVYSVSFSPDGQTLASGHERTDGVRLWDVATGALLHIFNGHTGAVNSVHFSPDGQTLISGSRDSTVRLWDVITGVLLKTLTGHTNSVNSVHFSPDGQTLASTSPRGGTVLLWAFTPPELEIAEDLNGDGTVNVLDLMLVNAYIRQKGKDSPADVNGDGMVNIADLVWVASALGSDASGAPVLHPQMYRARMPAPMAADVQQWLTQAQQLDLTQRVYLRGIATLEQLLANLTPKETTLLGYYPFPLYTAEVWIFYQLATPADVTLTISMMNGEVVRVLEIGPQAAGIYQHRNHAAYWDGHDAQGELLAGTGQYFYTLTAGDFAETKRIWVRRGPH